MGVLLLSIRTWFGWSEIWTYFSMKWTETTVINNNGCFNPLSHQLIQLTPHSRASEQKTTCWVMSALTWDMDPMDPECKEHPPKTQVAADRPRSAPCSNVSKFCLFLLLTPLTKAWKELNSLENVLVILKCYKRKDLLEKKKKIYTSIFAKPLPLTLYILAPKSSISFHSSIRPGHSQFVHLAGPDLHRALQEIRRQTPDAQRPGRCKHHRLTLLPFGAREVGWLLKVFVKVLSFV